MRYSGPEIKDLFRQRVEKLENSEPVLKQLFSILRRYGTAYVVGGFVRDILNDKNSRDIDIIADIQDITLADIIQTLDCEHTVNRQKGVKLHLSKITVDIWDIRENWAFKNKLVKLNPRDKLNSIAKGCFYNYDSLVINLYDYKYNMRYYKQFCSNNKLDIILKSDAYRAKNHSIDANIIRAFFIKNQFKKVSFSDTVTKYILSRTNYLSLQNDKWIESYLDIKRRTLSIWI